MNSRSAALPDPAAWHPQQLRLTAFPIDSQGLIDRDWWQEVFGEPAETTTRKRPFRTDAGMINERAVQVSIDPMTVTCVVQPKLDLESLSSAAHGLGSLPTVIGETTEFFARLIASLPPVRRLACGWILLQSVQDHDAGYRLLDAYLPDVHVGTECSDFSYRINRKRSSSLGGSGFYTNRLSTWSVIRSEARTAVLAIVPGTMTRFSREEVPHFSCTLELDINTPAEREEALPRERLPEIWTELVGLGLEIAAQGDIP